MSPIADSLCSVSLYQELSISLPLLTAYILTSLYRGLTMSLIVDSLDNVSLYRVLSMSLMLTAKILTLSTEHTLYHFHCRKLVLSSLVA